MATTITSPTTPYTPQTAAGAAEEPFSNANSSISASEIQYIISGCTANFRLDGRTCLDYRSYTLTTSCDTSRRPSTSQVLILSNGSSRLLLPGSATDILCSIRAELVRPPPSDPRRGVLDLNVDILPSASSASATSNRSKRRNEEMELASILSHLFLPHAVDRESLCIVPSKYVWKLNIDLLVVRCDGNWLDACTFAIRGALTNLMLPRVTPVLSSKNSLASDRDAVRGGAKVSDELMLDGDVKHAITPLGVHDCPVVVTVCLLPKDGTGTGMGTGTAAGTSVTDHSPSMSTIQKVKKRGGAIMIVDARSEEEACASAKVSVSVDPSGRICGVHKYGNSSSLSSFGGGGGGSTMAFTMLKDVCNLAVATSKKIFNLLGHGSSSSDGEYDPDSSWTMLHDGNGQASGSAGKSLLQGHFQFQ